MRDRSKTPTPHHSRPVTPQRSPSHMSHSLHAHTINGHTSVNGHTALTSQDVSIMLSPETALPPPPSPPCACGKVGVLTGFFEIGRNEKP